MSADLLKRLAQAGTPLDLIMEVAETLADAKAAERLLEKRREKDRLRKRNSKDSAETVEIVETAEIHTLPLPPLPPLKTTPDPEKITPPISPKPTTEMRARRLPADWEPGPVIGKAADMLARWPPGEVERELAKFRNYWLAKAGKDACKTDWQRTWINWLISADERKPNNGGLPLLGKTSAAIAGLGDWDDNRPM